MSSNYPPGVTGLEPQIAGYDETDATRDVGECVRECGFKGGEVEGVLVGPRYNTVFVWECPVCGNQDEEDVDAEEFEPDPDAGRDDF